MDLRTRGMNLLVRCLATLTLCVGILTANCFGQLHSELAIEDEEAEIRHFGVMDDSTLLVGATYDELYVWDIETGEIVKQLRYSADRMAVNSAAGHVLLRKNRRGDSTSLDMFDIATQEMKTTELSFDLKPLQFSKDGKRVLCENAEEDGYQVYEYPAMKPLLPIRLKQENTQDIVELSPDGEFIAFVDDSIAEIWSVDSGSRIAKSGAHLSSIRTLAFSPDSQRIAIGGKVLGREGLGVFHTKTLLPIQRNVFECYSARGVAWSSDGMTLGVLFDSGRGCLVDPVSYELKASFRGDGMKRMFFVSDGGFLATTHSDGGPSVWDWQASLRFQQPRLAHDTHPPMSGEGRSSYKRSLHVLWNRDGSRLAITHPTSVAYETEVRRGGIANITTATRDNIADGTGNRKPRPTVTRYQMQYRISLLDPKTGRKTNTLSHHLLPALHDYHVDKLGFTRDGSRLACLLKKANTFAVWNPENNHLAVVSDDTTRNWPYPKDFDFSPSGKTVAFVASDDLYGYDIAKNQITLRSEGEFQDTIRFNSDDEFLSGFDSYTRSPISLQIKGGPGSDLLECNRFHAFSLRYERTNIGRLNLETLVKPSPFLIESPALCISLSEDGHLFAAGCVDGIIRVWNVANGRLLTNLKGHTGSVESIDFAPQGLILASAGLDGQTMIWDLREWKDARVAQQKPSLPTQQTFYTADGATVSVSFDRPASHAEVTASLSAALRQAEGTADTHGR